VLPAILLAAGDSIRMGSPKAVLETPDRRPFVAAIVRALHSAGVDDVVIVTGRDHDRVVDAIGRDAPPPIARVVRNPDPSRGQLSSLWVGMAAAITRDTQGLLVTLVDVPLVSPATIRQVIDVWQRTRAVIVRPAIGARHGHPVVFDRALFDELRAAPLEQGAKTVVRAHARGIVEVAVDDEGAMVDIDTPADYAAMRNALRREARVAGGDDADG
jgi:molybdenum cofactor cytidylyltransferase